MIVGHFPDTVELALTIPEKACDGHFPDQPLVPGVLQLQLVAEALGISPAAGVAVGGVPRLRFRKPIVPGDESRIEARRSGSTWRFRIITDKRIVSEGAIEMATLPALTTGESEDLTSADIERVERCLPHRAPMLLVHRILDGGEGWGICAASVPEEAPFVRDGAVPAVAAIEVAAQSLGLIEGEAGTGDGPPKLGLLVGISNARMAASTFPVGSALRAQVQRTAWVAPMARAEARITSGDHEVASCTLTTWTPEAEEEATEEKGSTEP